MANLRTVTRICPGCGRPFTVAQVDFDKQLERNSTFAVFCSTRCEFHGWDPRAVWFGNMRRYNDK